MRSSLSWNVTQCWFVVGYVHFRTYRLSWNVGHCLPINAVGHLWRGNEYVLQWSFLRVMACQVDIFVCKPCCFLGGHSRWAWPNCVLNCVKNYSVHLCIYFLQKKAVLPELCFFLCRFIGLVQYLEEWHPVSSMNSFSIHEDIFDRPRNPSMEVSLLLLHTADCI